MAERSLLAFAAYAIDRENEQLWLDNQPVRLTNKAFAVLRYLVEHPGQLVTKDALFAAVWPETIVSENTLTNCIGELRQALGDNPKAPQFIATVHRRGYRWLVSLRSALPVPSSNLQLPSPPPSDPQSPAPVLVGREAELTQLHQLFVKAMNGERQVVFVIGEAGIGKTALVDTFLHRLESGVQGLASQRSQRPKAKGQRQENQTPDPRHWSVGGVWPMRGAVRLWRGLSTSTRGVRTVWPWTAESAPLRSPSSVCADVARPIASATWPG